MDIYRIFFNSSFFLLTLILSIFALAEDKTTEVPLIPLEKIAKLPTISDPVLSPSGERLAAVMVFEGREYLVMAKMPDKPGEPFPEISKVELTQENVQFNRFYWPNDDRLIVSFRTTNTVKTSRGRRMFNYTQLGSIGNDGKDFVVFKKKPGVNGYYKPRVSITSMLPADPDHVLAELDYNPERWGSPEVDKINVYTGSRKKVMRNRLSINEWIADNDGVIRIGVQIREKGKSAVTNRIYYRKTKKDSLKVLEKADFFSKDRLHPVKFHPKDNNILLVRNYQEDENLEDVKLLQYDLEKNQLLGPYVNRKVEKITRLVREGAEDYKVKLISKTEDEGRFLFKLHSDIQPTNYFLFDDKQKAFVLIGRRYQQLEGYKFAKMKRVTYTARDGLKIPAFLTLPIGQSENIPTVVLPHGGPHARDHFGFNNYVQFLANRGYAVLQPQFRGSTGFGEEFKEKGYGQWGMEMQDDITDGVKWLINEGIADASRICIMGGSYGGYATSMGLVKTPDLYKCGIAINGVHDYAEFIKDGSIYMFSNIRNSFLNEKDDIKENSPYHQAKRINAPLLLIYGDKDTVVSPSHSKKMYKRLKKRKHPVAITRLKGGEHWRTDEKNELIKFKAIEDFLHRHLGGRKG